MDIKNHWIEEIRHTQTSNLSPGTITPRFVVTHYTTGWDGVGSRNWLQGAAGGHPESQVSAHIVIDVEGTAWQIAPFNRRAWHAGPSRYGSVTDLNAHAIGLEFANPGWLKPNGPDRWVDFFGNQRTTQQLEARGGFIQAPHPRVGAGSFAWPLYPPAQIKTGLSIVAAIVAKYRIEAILTHEEIDARGWKTDPGPAFPQRSFEDLLGQGGAPASASRYLVSATRLNLRGGPSETAEKLDPPGALPLGTEVESLRAEGVWHLIEVKAAPASDPGLAVGVRGWVHGQYLDLILSA